MPNNQDSPRFNIPGNITREHIIQAIKDIDVNGYPEKNESRKYDVFYNGKRYPPKVVISLANKFANGIILDVSEFSGGEEFANKFLKERDFEIIQKNETNSNFEYESYSWKIISHLVATKKMDKSSFLHHGTVIPQQIRGFFGITNLKPEEKKRILLWYHNNRHEAHIEMTTLDSPRTRMMWKSDFSMVIQSSYQKWFDFFNAGGVESEDTPSLKFVKRSMTDEYDVEFIDSSLAEKSISSESNEDLILTKYQEYTRKDVHDIFEKSSLFTSRSGKWGIRGIISHPFNFDDFIFFVTFGHKEGGFSFEESVTEGGVLTWQSEPKQKLNDPVIQKFISHDYTKNTIHLFLRTNKNRKYSYLGRLAYIKHDNEREEPVHFKWQILDWDLDQIQAEAINLDLLPDHPLAEKTQEQIVPLIQTAPPEQRVAPFGVGEKSKVFLGKKVDFAENEQKKKEVGKSGEDLVINLERETLIKLGSPHLINDIQHVSKTQGDGAGYDIKSITLNKEPKYIEVKTTVGGINTPFILTINELNFSKQYAKNYHLYRIYDFNIKNNTGKYYVIAGDISRKMSFEPIQFNCRPQIRYQEVNYLQSNDS